MTNYGKKSNYSDNILIKSRARPFMLTIYTLHAEKCLQI